MMEELQQRLGEAGDSPERLRGVFAWLSSAVGSSEASWMWWRVFGESDASET